MQDKIFRSLENPRTLDVCMRCGQAHAQQCPHKHNKQSQQLQEEPIEPVELEAPALTVEILPTGEVVGKVNKQHVKEHVHVQINKFGDVVRAD